MKIISKYVPNEWIILAPIITICAIVNEQLYAGLLNDIVYYIEIVAILLLTAITLLKISLSVRNEIKIWKNANK
jgi:hypothetical protein